MKDAGGIQDLCRFVTCAQAKAKCYVAELL